MVRRHVHARPIPMDVPLHLETALQRPWDAPSAGEKPVPAKTAALYPRRVVPLLVRAIGQPGGRVVEARAAGRLAPSPLRRRPRLSAIAGRQRLEVGSADDR